MTTGHGVSGRGDSSSAICYMLYALQIVINLLCLFDKLCDTHHCMKKFTPANFIVSRMTSDQTYCSVTVKI